VKPYTGDYPVSHRVQAGESLSRIAQAYGFQRWEPIYVYNTKIHRILGADPNFVPQGEEIWIPRSNDGYDRLVRKLRALQSEAAGRADQILYQLEGEWNKHQAERVKFDFYGDVLTLLGTVGAKAIEAALKARMAALTTGRAHAAAQYLADQAAKKLAEELGRTLKDKAINAALSTVDEYLADAHKRLYLSQKKGLDAIQTVSLRHGKSLLDIADLVLDYASVSNVADMVLAHTVLGGRETPEQTYQQAVETVRKSARATQAALSEKIYKIDQEKRIVYVT